MQFQVPQFIDTEDKIVGPLSLRQFIYIGIGVGICGALYFVLQTAIWVILSILIVGGAGALSFVKIEGRPLVKVLAAAFNFYWSPRTYIWQPEEQKLPKAAPLAASPATDRASIVEKIAQGMALHRSWENVQTGERMSARQFTEKKMYGRYQIFHELEGDRRAARRVDYR